MPLYNASLSLYNANLKDTICLALTVYVQDDVVYFKTSGIKNFVKGNTPVGSEVYTNSDYSTRRVRRAFLRKYHHLSDRRTIIFGDCHDRTEFITLAGLHEWLDTLAEEYAVIETFLQEASMLVYNVAHAYTTNQVAHLFAGQYCVH